MDNDILGVFLMRQGDTSVTMETGLRRYLNKHELTLDKHFDIQY